jgi:hypothetical protein
MARQNGKTTLVGAFLVHYILFNRDKTCCILANKMDTALEIMDRIKLAYENLPLWLQQGVELDGWNAKSLKLENGSRLFASTTSPSSISGKSVSILYIDEFAKIPHHIAEQFITATYPVISSGKTTKIIITSTPLGMNHFYEFWSKAVKKKNNFYPIRVPWWKHPTRDKEWKDHVIRDIGKMRFRQEFSLKFLGSSSTLIDADYLEQIDVKDPVDDKWNGALKIYENPIPGALYVMGVDTGKGIGKDRSVIQVLRIIDKQHIEQVAIYINDKILPHDYADVCKSISQYYNGAMLMVESNGEGKGLLSALWYELEYENVCNIDKKGLGIFSNKSNKLEANMLLKTYMEKEWLNIYDGDTVYELSRYVEVRPNVFKSESDVNHDDCVTSLLWALYFLTTPYYDDKLLQRREIADKFKLKNNEEDEPIMIFDEGADNNNMYDVDDGLENVGSFDTGYNDIDGESDGMMHFG